MIKKTIKNYYCMNALRYSITTCLLCLGLFNISAYSQIRPLPRDTGYTVHHEYHKIHKHHPYATIASTDVPSNVKAHFDVTYLSIPHTPYPIRHKDFESRYFST
jgi:hypothetical protein